MRMVNYAAISGVPFHYFYLTFIGVLIMFKIPHAKELSKKIVGIYLHCKLLNSRSFLKPQG